jgi:hypothetical protein
MWHVASLSRHTVLTLDTLLLCSGSAIILYLFHYLTISRCFYSCYRSPKWVEKNKIILIHGYTVALLFYFNRALTRDTYVVL